MGGRLGFVCWPRRVKFGPILGAMLALLWAQSAVAVSACSETQLHLRGDWGQARFTVELADDPQEQAQGLMHRDKLASSAGMLFVYEAPRAAYFWMRNTLIPLDMLFIDAQGVVQHIHHMAEPLDETPIFGGEAVFSVLEINGGLAAQLQIDEGSEVRHPAFSEHMPAWPC
jgi:uncharacterized protein